MFFVKSFGECCGSAVLTAACFCHQVTVQTFVSVSTELNHTLLQYVLDSDKGVYCQHFCPCFISGVGNSHLIVKKMKKQILTVQRKSSFL